MKARFDMDLIVWAVVGAVIGMTLMCVGLYGLTRPTEVYVISEPELRGVITAYQDSLEWERKHHTWLEMVCPDTTGSGQ